MKRHADIVRLRIFLEEETAQMLECSSETVTKEYRKAKAKIARIVGDWGHGYPDSVPDPFCGYRRRSILLRAEQSTLGGTMGNGMPVTIVWVVTTLVANALGPIAIMVVALITRRQK